MSPTPPPGPGTKPRRRPLILLGLLSLVTFFGPLAIVLVGRGGDKSTWPPDRAVEWRVFLAVTIGYVVLLVACLYDARRSLLPRRQEGASPASNRAPSSEANS